MPIRRNRNFYIPSYGTQTFIHDAILFNATLSWDAKGLWCYLVSLPKEAEITIENAFESGPDSREVVEAAFKELIDSGFLICES